MPRFSSRDFVTKLCHSVAGSLVAGAASGGVACLFVLALVLFYQVTVSGSAADWVVSFANAVMAVTAVLAFFAARRWLPQLTTQEGYKLAIELINEHYIWLGPQNSLLTEVGLPMAQIRHLQDGKTMAGSAFSYEVIAAALDKTLLEHKHRRDAMDKIRFRLGTYGLREAHSVRARFETLDRSYRNTCDAAATLRVILNEMEEVRKLYPGYIPDSGMMSTQPIDEKLLSLLGSAEHIYKILEEEFGRMVQTHTYLFDARPTIVMLFEVKK